MPEYRPCIATETIFSLPDMQEKIEQKDHKALFHQWIKKIVPHYENKPFSGEFVIHEYIGNDEALVAVVEYEDGSIHEHLSQEIQFTDGMAEKISKK